MKFCGLLVKLAYISFLAIGTSATSQTVNENAWLYFDTNAVAEELVSTRKAAAASGAKIFVVKNITQMNELLLKQPELKFETVIVSGHASGCRYQDNLHSGAFVDKPAFASTTYFIGSGCQTGVAGFAAPWKIAFPNLEYLFGFDGSGPSSDAAGEAVEKIAAAMRKAPRGEVTPSDLKKHFGPASKFKNRFRTNLSVSYINGKKVIHHSFNVRDGESITFDLSQGIPNALCDANMLELAKALEAMGVDRSLQDSRGSRGIRDVYYPYSGGPFIAIPKDAPNTPMRKAYNASSRLEGCDPKWFETSPVAARLQIEGPSMLGYLKQELGSLIHSEDIISNFEKCSKEGLRQIKDHLQKCGHTQELTALKDFFDLKSPWTRAALYPLYKPINDLSEKASKSDTPNRHLYRAVNVLIDVLLSNRIGFEGYTGKTQKFVCRGVSDKLEAFKPTTCNLTEYTMNPHYIVEVVNKAAVSFETESAGTHLQ